MNTKQGAEYPRSQRVLRECLASAMRNDAWHEGCYAPHLYNIASTSEHDASPSHAGCMNNACPSHAACMNNASTMLHECYLDACLSLGTR